MRRGRRDGRGTVVIAAERCKGCELCIPACPPRVLRMSETRNANGYARPGAAARLHRLRRVPARVSRTSASRSTGTSAVSQEVAP